MQPVRSYRTRRDPSTTESVFPPPDGRTDLRCHIHRIMACCPRALGPQRLERARLRSFQGSLMTLDLMTSSGLTTNANRSAMHLMHSPERRTATVRCHETRAPVSTRGRCSMTSAQQPRRAPGQTIPGGGAGTRSTCARQVAYRRGAQASVAIKPGTNAAPRPWVAIPWTS